MTDHKDDSKHAIVAKEFALRSFVRQRSEYIAESERGELDETQPHSVEDPNYLDIVKLWNSLDAISDHPTVLQMRQETKKSTMRRTFWRRSLVAASVIGAFSIGLSWWYQSSLNGWEDLTDIQIATGRERGQPVVLDDGSIITVDANSSVLVSMNRSNRVVSIEGGRAYFDISRDPKRPFTVIADGRAVKALGTEFAVDTLNGRFEVVLVEGRVRVEGQPRERHTSIEMQAGSKLSVLEGKWQATRIDAHKAKHWVEGRLEFENAPLSEVVDEMNRYAQHPIKIADDGTAEKQISMIVKSGNTNDFLEAVDILRLAKIQKNSDGSIFLHQ